MPPALLLMPLLTDKPVPPPLLTVKPLVIGPSVTVLVAPGAMSKSGSPDPSTPGFVIVTVVCANAGPAANGATKAVEAMSCVRSAQLILARVPAEIVPVDVMRFASLEIFMLVPRYM